MFDYLCAIKNETKWLSEMGSQLNDWLTRNGQLISEDINFIQSIIHNNNEIDQSFQSSFHSFKSSLSFRILSLSSIISIMVYSYYENVNSLSVITILTLTLFTLSLPLSLKNIYKFYLSYSLTKKVKHLTLKIVLETDLIKKLLKLIEMNEVIEKSDRVSVKLIEMKRSFRFVCWHLFSSFRNATILLRKKYPLKSEIDDELNFLCCLPIELFNNFLDEDSSNFTVNFLKSLRQLMRLQHSEFFRRLICIFMQICWNQTNKETKILRIEEINNIIDVLIDETNEIYAELYSSYSCANSYWIITEKSKTKSGDKSSINRSENIQLIDLNRSIRKYLISILSLVDDCDAIIEETERIENSRLALNNKIDCINCDLNKLNDLLMCMEKSLNIKRHKDIEFHNLKIKNTDKEDNEYKIKSLEEINDYIVTDQVFESLNALDERNENDLIGIIDDEESWEYRLKLAQEAEASSNLFQELKLALKSKAEEHKVREAKALGIEIDALNDEQNTCEQNKIINESNLSKADEDISLFASKHKQNNLKTFSPVNTLISDNQILFASQIASIAAEKGRIFGVSDNTECFGDDNIEDFGD